jgi:phytoene dehydrogenase-like protein
MSEVVILGAGADGLVAAHLLARGGHRVTVVAARAATGSTEGWVPAALARELGLSVREERPDPWLRVPLDGGGALELSRDMARSVQSIRRVSPRDAERWPRFAERMATLARLLERLYVEPPPSLLDLRFALRVRRLGREAMEDLMRLLPMPAAELLDDWFESDALKGGLATFAVRHLHQGPRSAGTAFVLLHHHVGNPAGIFRPPRTDMAPQLAGREGITLQAGRAARIAVKSGRATGVVLERGAELHADIVVSTLHPQRTLDELVEPGWLDPELLRALRHIRGRAVAAAMEIELERAPDFPTLTLAPTLDYVERAYDDVKYRRPSTQPWLDVMVQGKRAQVHCQYVPEDAQPAADAVTRMLAPQLPSITRTRVLPHDGPPHQAELTLDQALWMRPLPELSGYRTPIAGLWLGGPAMHPGIPGLCGSNCAREILRKP